MEYSLIILSLMVLFINVYSDIQLKNKGSLLERGLYLFTIKSLFNTLKLSLLIGGIILLSGYFNLEYFISLLEFPFISKILVVCGVSTVVSILILVFNFKLSVKDFENYYLENNYSKLNTVLASLQYLLYRLIAALITLIFFLSIFNKLIALHLKMLESKLALFDWLESSAKEVNYNNGVYFSLVLSIVFFIVFNNAYLKLNSNYLDIRLTKWSFLKYFFISVILSIGLFFGFFSIFNGIYNLKNIGFESWVSKENILGILPIRISSVLILTYLFSYIYKNVFHKDLKSFLVFGVLPVRAIGNEGKKVNLEHKETLFFCQISFYVINLALAELFIIYEYSNLFLSILNFSILFILDDFMIINDYFKRFQIVLQSHFIRLTLFNLSMILASFIILLKNQFYWYLVIYSIITFILSYYYIKNIRYYRIH